MAELFGFSFKKNQEKSRAPSPIQPSSDDGATSYIAGGYYGPVSYTHLTLPTKASV